MSGAHFSSYNGTQYQINAWQFGQNIISQSQEKTLFSHRESLSFSPLSFHDIHFQMALLRKATWQTLSCEGSIGKAESSHVVT